MLASPAQPAGKLATNALIAPKGVPGASVHAPVSHGDGEGDGSGDGDGDASGNGEGDGCGLED